MDYGLLLNRAQLCNAVYVDDAAEDATLFKQLGHMLIGRYRDPDHLAALVQANSGDYSLVICGTRLSEMLQGKCGWEDVWDDLDHSAAVIDVGLHVMAGFFNGLDNLFAWVKDTFRSDRDLHIMGHSMGGARTHLAPELWLPYRIASLTSFGAPKAANENYWSSFEALFTDKLTRVVAGNDLWVGYPWADEWVQPPSMLWLDNGAAEVITEDEWPGGTKLGDHSIDQSYIPRLQALATRAEAA